MNCGFDCSDVSQLRLEELLGIVAVTTFLVGFSTVRLQSSLQDWRQERTRVTDRLLQQNEGEDLLPEPVTLEHLAADEKPMKIGALTWATSLLTLGTVTVSVIFTAGNLWGDQAHETFQVVQGIHFLIWGLSCIDIGRTMRISALELERSTNKRFEDLEKRVREWLKNPSDSAAAKSALDGCDAIDRVIPDWCWLALVRSEIYDFQGNKEQKLKYEQSLHRLQTFANERRESDDYSNIAFIWSSYLIRPVRASLAIRESDVKRIRSFNVRRADVGDEDLMAQLALHCVKRKINIKG